MSYTSPIPKALPDSPELKSINRPRASLRVNAKTGHHVLLLLLLHQCIKKLEVHTQTHWRRVVSALGDRRCPLLLEFGMSMPMLPASHEESDGIAVVVKADVPCMS
jgi:hypothetical protein